MLSSFCKDNQSQQRDQKKKKMNESETPRFEDSKATIMGATEISNTPRPTKRQRTKYNLTEDIQEMMYGFGDEWPSDPQSVEVVEKLVVNYVKNLCHKALEVSDFAGIKLEKESFMYVVKRDRKKFHRTYTLLRANEELKKVQKYEMVEDESKE